MSVMDTLEKIAADLEELCARGILERVYTHPSDPTQHRYKLLDVEGTRRALEECGFKFD